MPNQVVECLHEKSNSYDSFAVYVCDMGKGTTIGHVLMESSTVFKFLLDRGA